MKTSVVIVAAGMGSRMKAGMNKQFLKLLEEPILYHTLKVFEDHEEIDEIILVVREEEIDFIKTSIVENKAMEKVSQFVVGGKERADSVCNGIGAIGHNDIVLIHDGARPLVSKEEISSVIDGVRRSEAAILGTPASNTMKKVDGSGFVSETLDRSVIWNISTPQGFKVDLIKKAFSIERDDSEQIWDDAMLVELMGEKVCMIEGSYENIKITTPIDIIIGESLLKKRREG